ncbi:MAG: right-handed parallel beta-helix repeat-containing protein [Planctomycetes bacterium]|nr:right-handed parallel beta-helix repeat-containing protein [Planctomycetota bacterium]
MASRPCPVPARAACALACAFAAGLASASAGTIRVPSEVPGVQAALDAAAEGDAVLVAPGEYVLAAPLTFRGKRVALRSEEGSAATTLRLGDPLDPQRASVAAFEGGEPPEAVLEGFTLTGGRGTRFGPGHTDSGGGGILCRNGSRPTVIGCLIAGNAARNGGGVLVDRGSAVTLLRSTLRHNQVSGFGGGVLCVGSLAETRLEDLTVEGNVSASGAGLFFLEGARGDVSRCRIEGNLANSVAGGMCCLLGGTPRLSRCVFLGNFAFGAGAVSCETAADNPELVNCLIAGNFAVEGGALQAKGGAAPRLVNCTLASNAATGSAGGVLCAGGTPVLRNTIVLENLPESACGDLAACLTAGPTPFARLGSFEHGRTRTVEIAGVPYELPDFVDDPGDYRPLPGSGAVDAGSSSGAPGEDLDGRERPCGTGVDIGAYELCAVDPPRADFRRGDSNADGKRDISDGVFVLLFLFSGGAAPACFKAADADDSGRLDISDGIFLLSFLFLGTAAPPAPGGACGGDPTPDGLVCEEHAPCEA